MILSDVNLLLYAHDVGSPFHPAARRWLEGTLDQPTPFALAWVTLLSFLRISTNPRALQRPYSVVEAGNIVAEWLGRANVRILSPGEQHWSILQRLLVQAQALGDLVSDAHLAALAIEHGALLCSTDRDFSRFPGLRWENPLET